MHCENSSDSVSRIWLCDQIGSCHSSFHLFPPVPVKQLNQAITSRPTRIHEPSQILQHRRCLACLTCKQLNACSTHVYDDDMISSLEVNEEAQAPLAAGVPIVGV